MRKNTSSLCEEKRIFFALYCHRRCICMTNVLTCAYGAAASSSGRELRSPRLADSAAAISRFFTQTGWLMRSKRVFTDRLRSSAAPTTSPGLSRVYDANTHSPWRTAYWKALTTCWMQSSKYFHSTVRALSDGNSWTELLCVFLNSKNCRLVYYFGEHFFGWVHFSAEIENHKQSMSYRVGEQAIVS